MIEEIDYLHDKLAKLELDIHHLQRAAEHGDHININFKLLDSRAKPPTKAHLEDAAWDLYALEDTYLFSGAPKIIRTGVAFEMPPGFHGMVWDRSSMGAKGIHVLGGLIDQPYTGEVKVILTNLNDYSKIKAESPGRVINEARHEIKAGDKIAQIVFTRLPVTYLHEKEELGESSRGEKGFGSSGR